MDALRSLAEQYLVPIFETLIRHQEYIPWLFYGWIAIVLAISFLRWRKKRGDSAGEPESRIATIPPAQSGQVRSNWGALLGALVFLIGLTPLWNQFPRAQWVVVGICALIVVLTWIFRRTISWSLVAFGALFAYGVHALSQEIARQAPWTRQQANWLYLMGGGLGLMILSLAIESIWKRRRWVVVRARCIDREVRHISTPGPESGKSWTFQLLCEFTLAGKRHQVTPAYWKTFISEAGVNRFLERKISPTGHCQLRVNPANPQEAQMGPDHGGREPVFPWGRLLKLAGLAAIVVAAVYGYDWYANHASRWEVIPNPMVRLAPVGQSEFQPSWTAGYPFAPAEKKRLADGRIQLVYKGRIANPTLSLTLDGVDYETCRKEGNHWVVNELATQQPRRITCPRVTMENVQPTDLASHVTQAYPSIPLNKNRQPDGRVIVSVAVPVRDITFGLLLLADRDFQSIEIRDGRFRVRTKE